MKPFRSILAIVLGFLSVVILSVVTDTILEKTGIFPPISSQDLFVTWMLVLAFIYRSIYAVVGGYIAAALAPSKPEKHANILGCIGILGGLAGVIYGWNLSAHWYPIALMLTALPCTTLGGKLRSGK